jgi:phage-related baseplate assembly protein
MTSPQPLPEPSFIERDAASITSDMVTMYENMAGKTLYPAQPERLMVDVISYREMGLRIAIQEAAEDNLVAYAPAPMLDYLGQLVCVTRLDATAAGCQAQVTLTAAQATDTDIPSGLTLTAKDGSNFLTAGAATVAAGLTSTILNIVAAMPGAAGNGFLAGEITGPSGDGWPTCVSQVANIGVSYGGADVETDDRLRSRIVLGPEAFAVAGPEASYRAHALGAHQDIVDVAMTTPWPGLVNVYVLTSSGQPNKDILDLVTAALTPTSVRPLTDQVMVLPPSQVNFEIISSLTLYSGADATQVQSDAQTALATYANNLRQQLGQAVVPSQIITLIGNVNGVYDVELQSPQSITLATNQWANCTNITLNVAGYANANQ